MEQFYYNHMTKQQQAAYHNILTGVKNLSDEFQIPVLPAEELANVFFQMRLDHPEVFWTTGFRYRYYKDSSNLIFVPEYLFDKNKIREHQKAMTARVEKLARPAAKMSESAAATQSMIFSVNQADSRLNPKQLQCREILDRFCLPAAIVFIGLHKQQRSLDICYIF